jgi:hypothetical protein
MFCAPGHFFDGTVGVGYRFHVLRSRTRFQRYRDVGSRFHVLRSRTSFLAAPRVSSPVFMFCAPGHVFGRTEVVGSRFKIFRFRTRLSTEGVGSHFLVLRSRARFRWYRGCRVSFSCFALPDSFSTVPRASGPVFMFCVPMLIFGGNEGVGSRFHVLRTLTSFRRYRGRRIPFSCFELPNSFSAMPSASGPVFKFCAAGLIFGVTEGVVSLFHVLRSRTLFRRYRGCRVPFAHFALLDSFSAVSGALGPIFLVLCARTRF